MMCRDCVTDDQENEDIERVNLRAYMIGLFPNRIKRRPAVWKSRAWRASEQITEMLSEQSDGPLIGFFSHREIKQRLLPGCQRGRRRQSFHAVGKIEHIA
jgi:hypothetical protein